METTPSARTAPPQPRPGAQARVGPEFLLRSRTAARARARAARFSARLLLLATALLLAPQASGHGFTNTQVNADDPPSPYVDNTTQSETTLAHLGGVVVVAYNDSARNLASDGLKFTSVSRSVDGGMTFTTAVDPLPDDGHGDGGDPILAADRHPGRHRLYLFTLQNLHAPRPTDGLRFFVSLDQGATWTSGPNPAPRPESMNPDAPWWPDRPDAAVDNRPGDGNGNIYVIYQNAFVGTGPQAKRLSRSTDLGLTWTCPVPDVGAPEPGSTNSVVSASLAVGNDHSVLVFYTASDGRSIQVRRSVDHGDSFGMATPVARLGNRSGHHILPLRRSASARPDDTLRAPICPRVAVHPDTGELFVAYHDLSSAGVDADVFLVRGSPDASAWTSPLRVNTDATATDQWQPAVAFNTPERPSQIRLLVTYYSREEDPENSRLRSFARMALPDGSGNLHFQPPFPVGSVAAPPTFSGVYKDDLESPGGCLVDQSLPSDYMGDYDAVIGDEEGFLHAWSDGRTWVDVADCNGLPTRTPEADVRFAQVREVPRFTVLELSGGSGTSMGLGISPSAAIVVGHDEGDATFAAYPGTRRRRPCRWDGCLPGSELLPWHLPEAWCQATAIDHSGAVVGYATDVATGLDLAFHCRGGARPTLLQACPAGRPGWSSPRANHLTRDGRGRIVGRSRNPAGVLRPVLWRGPDEPPIDLGALGGGADARLSGDAHAINAGGTVVGASRTAAGTLHAFRSRAPESGLTPGDDLGTLGPSPASTSEAYAINGRGDCVGVSEAADGVRTAFLLPATESALRPAFDIGGLGGPESVALGVNDRRWVVGSALTAGGEWEGWIWVPGRAAPVPLNTLLVGGQVDVKGAEAINDAGQIAGWGIVPGSRTPRAVLLTPVP